jgi:DNA polymerase-3 subunit alpha
MVHLHCHSIYSVLDGLMTTKQLAELGKDSGALAICDHGVLSGAIPFYRDCKAIGVKPILGVESYYVFNGSRYHVCIYARNTEGYKQLLSIQSDAGRKNNKFSIIDMGLVAKYNENLIVTTGCSTGLPMQIAQTGDEEQLTDLLIDWQSKYKHLFAEFQPNPDYINGYKLLISVSNQLGIPHIVTSDIHYPKKEDFSVYQDLHRIMTQKESKLELKWLYPWEPQDLNTYFLKNGFPGDFVKNAIRNADEIAADCTVELDFDRKWHFDENITRAWNICKARLAGLATDDKLEYIKRLSYELKIFQELELVGYLLFCSSIIDHCKKDSIPYGPGRGSCSGSLVCFLLGITEIDPFVFDLSFDRFLSPSHNIGMIDTIHKHTVEDTSTNEEEVWFTKV